MMTDKTNQVSQETTLDCLLISPPIFDENRKNIWKQVNSNFPPPGLLSIAAYVRSKGHSVRVIDCNIASPSVESFRPFFEKEFTQRFSSIKVVGLTAMTCTVKKAYQIAQICKRYYPDALMVFGGVHATFVTNEVINNPFIDVVVLGEGEITMEEIVAGNDLNKIKGIVFKKFIGRDKYSVVTNAPRERIVDLDSLPMPAYDLVSVLKYQPAKGSYKKLPAMSMMTSRGCPGRCTFCSKTLGDRIVFKSAEKILEEIQYLIRNYKIRQILFYDDTFTAYKDNVIKLCDLIVENKINIAWTCFARVDFIDLEMLKKMKKAGCHQIMYGIENIDASVLKNLNKNTNLAQVTNAVNWTKEAGIECRVAFMVGSPGDNEEIVRKNINFIKKLNPDLLIANITTPFPGTPMFRWAEERNLILTHNWDDYTLAKPVMRLENLSASQIQNLYRLMYKSFYFRPSYVFKRLLGIRTIDDVKILLGGLKSLFSFLK